MRSTDKRLRLCKTLLVLMLAFIWGNSLMPGPVSQAISDFVKELLFGSPSSPAGSGTGSGLIRKAAHFTEFAALGMLLAWLCGMLEKKRVWPMLGGVTAACIDETIQAFVPERAPGLRDVLLDSCGVLAGIVLLHLGHTYLKRKSTKLHLEDK